MSTQLRSVAERRKHPRIAAEVDATCRRIGGRPTPDREMRVLDMSLGGVRMLGSGHFLTGDVVILSVTVDDRPLEVKGLVVSCSIDTGADDGHFVHMAFTSMAVSDGDRLERLIDELAAGEINLTG